MRLSLRLTLVALLTLLTWGGQVNAKTVTFDPSVLAPSNNTLTNDGISIYVTTSYSSTHRDFIVKADYNQANAYFAEGSSSGRELQIQPADGSKITKITFTFGKREKYADGYSGLYNPSIGTLTGADGTNLNTYGSVTYRDETSTWTGSASQAFYLWFAQDLYLTKIVVEDDRAEEQPVSNVTPPTISIATGTKEFEGSTTVTISADEGANIYYTVDGSEPTTGSTKYTEPFEITKTTTVRAIAEVDGELSNIVSSTFTNTVISSPVITSSAPYSSSSTITITADEGATVYYKAADQAYSYTASDLRYSDGTIYSGPFTISGTKYIYAVAYVGSNHGEVASEKFPKELDAPEKTIAELANEKTNYDAVTIKLENAKVAGNVYEGYDYSTYQSYYDFIVREGDNAIDFLKSTNNWYGGDAISGTITVKVTYNEGIISATAIDGITNTDNITKVQGNYQEQPIDVTTIEEASKHPGDLVAFYGVELTRDGDNWILSDGTNSVTLTQIQDYYLGYLAENTPYYLKLWYNTPWTADSKTLALTTSAKNVTPATVEVGTSGYASFYASQDNYGNYSTAYIVPENVTATSYHYDPAVKKLVVTKVYNANDTIPESTGVVIKADPGTYNLKLSPYSVNREYSNYTELTGYDEDHDLTNDNDADSYYYYGLSLNSENDPKSIGFYWLAEDGNPFTTKAHKAYIRIPRDEAANIKGFALNGDDTETTGIQSVISASASELNVNAPMYNLSGQRVGKSFKGIVIQNGKKFVVK